MAETFGTDKKTNSNQITKLEFCYCYQIASAIIHVNVCDSSVIPKLIPQHVPSIFPDYFKYIS